MFALLIYLVFSYVFGFSISRFTGSNKSFILNLPLSLCLGMFSHVLLAHLIALTIGDYSFCINLSLIFITIYLIASFCFVKFNKKEVFFNFEKSEKVDFLALFSALVFGITFTLRELTFGNPDSGHLAITSSIYENSVYPPYFPTGLGFSMSYYHYAVDLLLAVFKHISGFSIWEVTSFQIGLGAFLTMLAVFVLFNSLSSKKAASYLVTIILVFYTSINSLEYLFREFATLANIDLNIFLKQWLLVSWTSVSHMTSQLRLLGQNIGLPIMFVLLTRVYELLKSDDFINLDKKIASSFSLIVLSWALYFCYPTYWYPLFISLTAILVLKLFFRQNDLKWTKALFATVYLLALIYIGKFLTFTSSHTSFDGINSMIMEPSSTWAHWGKSYIRYFYDLTYLKQLATVTDHMNYSKHLLIPLFSSISFREFGPSLILALMIFVKEVFDSIKNKIVKADFLIAFITFSSLLVPFIFEFILRPIETSRFLLVAKIFALLYVLQFVVRNINLSKMHISLKLLLAFVISVMLVPGFISILPSHKFRILQSHIIPKEKKELLTKLSKIHKDGDVILDSSSLGGSYDFASIAGFYGVGGQFFKYDKVTRVTALKTFDIGLLKELKINYIVLEKGKSNVTLEQVNQPYLQVIDLGMRNYMLLKVNDKYALPEDYTRGYEWAVGYQPAELDQLQILKRPDGSELIFADRSKAQAILPALKKSIAKSNPIVATWVKEYAVLKDRD